MTYSEIIKQLMIERDLSQEKLARILSVNQTTVGQWLNGKKKPSYDNILAFYTHFGITPNEFFGIDEGWKRETRRNFRMQSCFRQTNPCPLFHRVKARIIKQSLLFYFVYDIIQL